MVELDNFYNVDEIDSYVFCYYCEKRHSKDSAGFVRFTGEIYIGFTNLVVSAWGFDVDHGVRIYCKDCFLEVLGLKNVVCSAQSMA